MRKQGLIAMFGAALTFVGGWVAAQAPLPSPAAPPAADLTVPLKNPLNRNPARREPVPDTPPAPPDPRDSTTRPVVPPGDDDRDAVLPVPGKTQPPGATRTLPAPGKP